MTAPVLPEASRVKSAAMPAGGSFTSAKSVSLSQFCRVQQNLVNSAKVFLIAEKSKNIYFEKNCYGRV